jgi:serine/threonine protein kinase/Leucine-rich repeat (LRR) protein
LASPSQVESIFFAALEKKASAERSAYLDQACGADSALRLRVEKLLDFHPRAMDFLAQPAINRRRFNSHDAFEDLTSHAPTSDSDARPRDLAQAAGMAETQSDERRENVELTLSFLQPAVEPGSLGRLAHYDVQEVLGGGGFGFVVKAFDLKLHRLVAIKLMSPVLAATSEPGKRFVREARATAAVRHENVIAIYAVEDQPIPYLVMEYIAGRTLQQKVEASSPLEVRDVLCIGRQIAAGLAAAHGMGLIHRDIKPANILLEDGALHVKITDFGLARAADDASITQSKVIAGTPLYMAPEQALGETTDQRADLFSLGSVLYTMCSGRPPFRAANTIAVLKRVVEDTPRPIQEINPEIPEWLCELISRLHAKNPADRITSAQDVADVLARQLAELLGPGSVSRVTDLPKSAVGVAGPGERGASAPCPVSESPVNESPVSESPVSESPVSKSPVSESPVNESPVNEVPRRQGADAPRSPFRNRLAGEIPKPASWIRWPRFFNRRWAAALALSVVLFGCLGLAEATGVTGFHDTVIRLFAPEGTLVVEVEDPGVSVKIDGPDIVITGAGASEIRLTPGNYMVEARKDGKVVSRELVTVTRNGRRIVRVSQEAPRETKVAARSAEMSAWERVVAALSAAEQVKAFSARLKELNPNFDSPVVPTIENGVVRELAFNTDDVTDLSPLRAFTRLRALRCSGFGDRNSPLTDLSPLSGLPLRTLVLAKSELFDLSPLAGMPLTEFKCFGTRVNDLSPLQGMKLRTLNCDGLHVSDLSPLMGMPLEALDLTGTKVEHLKALAGMKLEQLGLERTKVSDLSPLKGMPLTALSVCGTSVSDLSPLKGMKLTFLHCGGSSVADLSPLSAMPLTNLNCAGTKVSDESLNQMNKCHDLRLLVLSETQVSDLGLAHLKDHKNLRRLMLQGTRVSDLSPLADMPLEEIRLTPKNLTKRGLEILRNMKALKTIGTDWNQAWPAAEFWARYEKGEFNM